MEVLDTFEKSQLTPGSVGTRVAVKRPEKTNVEVTVVFLTVHTIDTANQRFCADVYIQSKWIDHQLKLDEGHVVTQNPQNDAWMPVLNIDNMVGSSGVETRFQFDLQSDNYYHVTQANLIIGGVFLESLELEHFPFDTQEFSLTLSSFRPHKEISLLESKSFPSQCLPARPEISTVTDWNFFRHTETESNEIVKSWNKSDMEEDASVPDAVRHPAIVVMGRASRLYRFFLFNSLMVFSCITCLAFSAFSIGHSIPQFRIAATFVLLLSCVSFKNSLTASLPKVAYLTYHDIYAIAGLMFLCLITAYHALISQCEPLLHMHAPSIATIDLIALIMFGAFFILFVLGYLIGVSRTASVRRNQMFENDDAFLANEFFRAPSRDKKPLFGTFEKLNLSPKPITKWKDVKRSGKVPVSVRVVFLKYHTVNTVGQRFIADVYVEAKWQDPNLRLVDTSGLDRVNIVRSSTPIEGMWLPMLTVDNLDERTKTPKMEFLYTFDGRKLNSGYEVTLGVKITGGCFIESLELEMFPFDTQELSVTVSSSRSTNEVEVVENQSQLSECLEPLTSTSTVTDWRFYRHAEPERRVLDRVSVYPLTDQADDKRSALTVSSRASRVYRFFLINSLTMLTLFVSLAFTAFAIKTSLPQNRLLVSFMLLLSVVAFKSSVGGSLPKVQYLTMHDIFAISGLIFLCVLIAWHAIISQFDKMFTDPDGTKRWYADKAALVLLAVIFLVYLAGFIAWVLCTAGARRNEMAAKDKEFFKRKGLTKKQQPKLSVRAGKVGDVMV